MQYDLAIIGAGWAGFNAALKAKQLGLKVVLIEKLELGGVCLNRGCIPTKTLLQSAKILSLIKKSAYFGIETTESKVNFARIQERKIQIITQLRQGMQFMLKGIDYLDADAQFISPQTLTAAGNNIDFKSAIIATGSKATELKGFEFNNTNILSSDQIIELPKIPDSLLIVGGGVIGCEFASLFSTLGSKVTISEKMPRLLPAEDLDISKKLENIFKKKGIKVLTGSDASKLPLNNFEKILICIGRKAVSQGIGLEKTGVKTENNRIITDDFLMTSGIYAAGDCTAGIMLAHFAAYQGTIAAENIAVGNKLNASGNTCVPNCIFTDPEIGSVGILDEEAKRRNISIEIRKFDFLASGMARIFDETDGFIKLVSDKNSGILLGASIIGPRATEIIATLTLAIKSKQTLDQLRNTIFAHPTLSEVLAEVLK